MTTQLKQRGLDKVARIPVKVRPLQKPLKKPSWIRAKTGNSNGRFGEIKRLLREQSLHTVCEEAACPNIGECFGRGTATFMILGDLCTRRCPFCDVGHGKPLPPDPDEPHKLAESVARLGLKYVVITSVNRDDLSDGGAQHFVSVVRSVRELSPATRIEILVPDFRGCIQTAIDILGDALPDVLNHNVESVPRLYRAVRPGADYGHSLKLLRTFKASYPQVTTKSGLMVGLGEDDDEVIAVMADLRTHMVDMLTVGQYLAPSPYHLPVVRYALPERFAHFEQEALAMGFIAAACGPMVRSSYWADQQADDLLPSSDKG